MDKQQIINEYLSRIKAKSRKTNIEKTIIDLQDKTNKSKIEETTLKRLINAELHKIKIQNEIKKTITNLKGKKNIKSADILLKFIKEILKKKNAESEQLKNLLIVHFFLLSDDEKNIIEKIINR